jgi:hypothetical protein
MKIIPAISLTIALLSGCNERGGGEYVGKWIDNKNNKSTLLIERNGDSFIVRDSHTSIITGLPETNNIPATYKDGMLNIVFDLESKSLAIDKASGNLTDGEREYKKLR